MIRSHIGSTRDCEVVLKLERFSHLSGRSFGLGLGTYHWCFYCLCIAGNDYLEEDYIGTLKEGLK